MCERGRGACVAVVGVTVLACAHGRPADYVTPVVAPAGAVVATLLLIGDAGAADRDFEPVLHALGRAIEDAAVPTLTVFLGDNVYPKGLPPVWDPGRDEGERRLSDQINAVVEAGGSAIFIPGNHDWARGKLDGWDAVLRAEDFIYQEGAPHTIQLPEAGCPGPVVFDLDPFSLVVLDTQWWLHDAPRPYATDGECGVALERLVLDSLRAILRDLEGRDVIVVAHHPLASGGKHGGHFGWQDHLFPLTEAVPWLFLPLPLIGSAYPIARQLGTSSQDLTSSEYRYLRDKLLDAFSEHPPLVFAGGHDHNLQVLEGPTVPYHIVSGSGIFGHGSLAHWTDSTLYASDAAGFMRLDATIDGGIRLGVLEVDESGVATEAYAAWLRRPTPHP